MQLYHKMYDYVRCVVSLPFSPFTWSELAMIYVLQCVLCQGVGRSSARRTIKTHPPGKLSHVFAAVTGAEGPPSPCSSPRSPSSADTQYHLSNYLDNWIWEGSQPCHYNQRHCQQRHREPPSSCIMGPDWARGWNINAFSAGWQSREDGHKSSGPKLRSPSQQERGSKCLQLHVKILKIPCPPWRMTALSFPVAT